MKIKTTLIAVLALACSLPAYAAQKPKPLKVFLFAGQSNMTGMARTRTLEHLKMSPDQGLEGDALKKAFTEYRAKNITPEEEILKKGVSDGDFHYLGSGKIMVGIGRGFAEVLAGILKK